MQLDRDLRLITLRLIALPISKEISIAVSHSGGGGGASLPTNYLKDCPCEKLKCGQRRSQKPRETFGHTFFSNVSASAPSFFSNNKFLKLLFC